MLKTLMRFLPFWIFLVLFKFGGGLHYSLVAPLGQKLFPLWIVGLLSGGCSIVQLLLDVPAGRVLDRYGYLRFLKITTVIFMIAAACFFFGLTKWTYLLSLVFSIFGWLFFGPGMNAYILSEAPKAIAGKFISLRDISGSVGIVLSSASLPFVLLLSVQWIGVVLFVLLLCAWIVLWFSPKDTVSVHAEQKLETQSHYIKRNAFFDSIRAMKRLNPASTMLMLTGFSGAAFYGVVWFVVPIVIATQARSGLLGIGLGIFDFAIVALGFFLGNLADKMHKRTLVFFGLLLFAIAGVLIGFHFDILFLLFGFLATTGDEMAMLSLWSWLHALDREHAHDGAVSGVMGLFEDLGWAIGPIIAGFLFTWIGPSWSIAIGAAPIFLTWILSHFLMRGQTNIHLRLADLPSKPHRRRHKM